MRGVPAGEARARTCSRTAGWRRESFGRRRLRADQRLAAGGVEPGQQGDELAVLAGHDRVLQHRRGGGERADPQRADMDPGAGGELEVLRQAPVEHDALGGIGRIGQAHRVARA